MASKWLRTFAVAVALSAVALAADTTSFERGLSLYAQGKMAESETALREALAANPYDQRAVRLLQVIRREHGLSAPVPADAGKTVLPQPASMDHISAAVLGRNLEVQQAMMRVVEARARLRDAKLSVGPEFSVLGRVYPLGVFASLTQSLFGGVFQWRAQVRQAEADVLAALADYARVRDQAVERALAAYIDLSEAGATSAVAQQLLSTREEQRRVVQVRFDYGSASEANRAAGEAEVAEARQQLTSSQARAVVARATLNTLMGRPADEPLAVTAERASTVVPADRRRALEDVQKHRPEIEAALASLNAARARRNVVLRDLPRIDLRGSWGSKEQERGDYLAGPSGSARITVPLLVWPLQKVRSQRELAVIDQMEFELARITAQTQLEAVTAWETLNVAAAQASQAEQTAAAAGQNSRSAAAVERWGGGADRLRSVNLEAQWQQARLRALAADFTLQRAAVHLQRTLGTLPEQLHFLPAAASTPEKTMSKQAARALWVWRPQFLEQPDAEWVLDFAAAHGINRLFLSASASSLQQRSEAYRRFLAAAHARGIAVEALQGQPDWALTTHHGDAEAGLRAVLAFNTAGEARFDGLHLDVEPHTLPQWKAGEQERIAAEFTALLRTLRQQSSGLPLTADVHPLLARVSLQGTPAIDSVVNNVDGVAVMAYQKDSDKIVDRVSSILALCDQRHKMAWVGISADPEHLPDSGPDALSDAVSHSLNSHPAFAGIAIHDLDRYQQWLLRSPGTQGR